MLNIFFKVLNEQKKSLFFWALGVVGLVAMYVSIYPSIKDSGKNLQSFLDKLPAGVKSLIGDIQSYTTPVGYLRTEMFAFMMPIVVMFYTIGNGASAIAGEEENGTLDTLLANPIARWKVVLAKFFSMVAGSSILSLFIALTLIIATAIFKMDVAPSKLVEMCISLDLLAIVFGSFALFVGSLTGTRSLAIGLSAGFAIISFFLNGLAPVVKFLADYQKFSPFYQYIGENPLDAGLKLQHVLILAGISVFFLILSLIAFQNRDLKI